ncbi:hypothetical protein ACLOJK_002953 [Asimina triloba]
MDLLFQLISLCCAFAVFISYRALTSSTATKGTKAPPEPNGALPFLGHLHLVSEPIPGARLMGAMADKLGSAFVLRLGLHRALFVSSWELTKECFTTNDIAMASRPKLLAGEMVGYNFAIVGFAAYGPYWRQIRKVMNLEILSAHRIESLKHFRIAEIEMSVRDLHRTWSKQGGEKLVVDMGRWIGDLSFNVMTMILAGKSNFGASNISDEVEARCFRPNMDQLVKLAAVTAVADALPVLRWLLWLPVRFLKRKDGRLIIGRGGKNVGKTDSEDRDFGDVMLSILEEGPIPGYDDDAVIKATSMIWVYSGDTDGCVPVLGTRYCMEALGLPVISPWRYWYHHDQVEFGQAKQSLSEVHTGSGSERENVWVVVRLYEAFEGERTCNEMAIAFDLDTPNGEPVDMTEALGLTMPRATPLEALHTPRLPSHLYDL